MSEDYAFFFFLGLFTGGGLMTLFFAFLTTYQLRNEK